MEIDKKKVIGTTAGGIIGAAIGFGIATVIGSRKEESECCCDSEDDDDDLENTTITAEASNSQD